MREEEQRYIEEMAIHLDENCRAFVLGYAEELPIVDFVTELYKADCRIVRDDEVIITTKEQEQLWKLAQNVKASEIVKRLWSVLIHDGEQFVAGELRKIAKEEGVEVDK